MQFHTVIIQPSDPAGKLPASPSKSSMQRAVTAAFLSNQTCVLHQIGNSADDLAVINIFRQLGTEITHTTENTLTIKSNYQDAISGPPIEVDVGESGLGVRMLTSVLATLQRQVKINGHGSLLSRPMHFFDDVLPRLGVRFTSNDNFLPVTLHGPMKPQDIEIDGSLSSQYLTGLLMAYATLNAKEKVIRVSHLKSKPYIDLTLDVMQVFGMKTPENVQYKAFRFTSAAAPVVRHAIHYTVEGDWSGASFLLVAGALAGPVTVRGLSMQSTQADRAIIEVLKACGAFIEIAPNEITVSNKSLHPFEFDATHCPDLFPPLVALAANCQGTSRIIGCTRLIHKESNRAKALQQEFGKLGIRIRVEGDEMIIYGGTPIQSATLDAHNDHRIAMACAVAATRAIGPVTISGAMAVNKSYPEFFNHFSSLGVIIQPILT